MTAGGSFDGRLMILGYGTVGRCALPLVFDLLGLPGERVVLVDRRDLGDIAGPQRDAGVTLLQRDIRPDSLDRVLGEVTRPGDLLLNLSVGTDALSLADWCQGNGVLYVDTALEVWDELSLQPAAQPVAMRTEYEIHHRARALAAARWQARGPTAVVTHGANPGLVSHFAKAALIDLAGALGLEVPSLRGSEDWAALAQATGTKVIHISERDTQVTATPRSPGEFVNTWSITGFIEEAMMPVEIGWGTHEKRLPAGARRHDEGADNAIFMPRAGAQLLLRSWVPLGGPIAGLALPHAETITISDYLTLRRDGRALYRPTVAFVYLPCDDAMASLHEMIMRDWRLPERERVLTDELVEGRDELGVLLLGHPLTGWWYGSQLDIHRARRLLPGHNATALQVAIGAVTAAAWAMANPASGYREPEDLPHEEILAAARPYLEPVVSRATDWTPLRDRNPLFGEPAADARDPWQFANFVMP